MGAEDGLSHYLRTHKILDRPVSATIELDPANYDGSPSRPMSMRRVLIPVVTEKSQVIVDSITRRIEPPEIQTGPGLVYVVFGGGAAGALENTGVVNRIEQAEMVDRQKENRGHWLERIVAFGHPLGSARDKKVTDMASSAEAIVKAINTEELGIKGRQIVLLGFSAGGTLATHVAARLGEQCEAVVLMDPAGMSDQPGIENRLTKGTLREAIKVSRKQGQRLPNLGSVFREIRQSWTKEQGTPPKILSIPSMELHDMQTKQVVGRGYGLEPDTAANSFGPQVRELERDTTDNVRKQVKCPVILSPVVYSDAVNVRLGKTISLERIRQMQERKGEKVIERAYRRQLYHLFPESRKHVAVPSFDAWHSYMLRDDNHWQKIVRKLQEVAH